MEKNLHILVVDDDLLMRRIIIKMLNNKSFIDNELQIVKCRVEVVESGKKAIETLKKEKIDIVICDIEMPEMDGIELCQIIRMSEKQHHLPFIFLSSHQEVEVRLETLSIGGNDYISKPFSIQELLVRIKRLVNSTNNTTTKRDSYNSLEQTSLKQSIELIIKHQLNGELNICFRDSSEATIEFNNGKIIKATFAQLEGEEAIKKIVSTRHVAYSFEGKTASDKGIVSSGIIRSID
ncbi:MAG: response regulators consisting of a CheY-like receiver domain and a winged-helix DNA-binding [bacterium]|nr:MAG: response regulators consisting of a CheY-like receiver domain and a winged-helix DNA-binding [bacterium]